MKISTSENQCLLEYSLDKGIPRFAKNDFLQELIKRDYIKETRKWSPLESACFWNENSVVKTLLENGYNPNWNNSSDLLYNALNRPGDGYGEHLSIAQRLNTVELLLKFGADPKLLISEDFGKGEKRLNFVEIANQWDFEDNIELIRLIKKYSK